MGSTAPSRLRAAFRPIFALRNQPLARVAPVIQWPGLRGSSRGSPLTKDARSTDNNTGTMRARRYTIVIADRSSGVVRRVGLSLRPAIAIALGILSVPVLMGLGAKWSAR